MASTYGLVDKWHLFRLHLGCVDETFWNSRDLTAPVGHRTFEGIDVVGLVAWTIKELMRVAGGVRMDSENIS